MKNLLRNLAYASVIIAAITITLHQFNRRAEANPPSIIAGIAFSGAGGVEHVVILDNGDVYLNRPSGSSYTAPATFMGNFFDGPIAAESTTWGEIKSRFGEK